MNLLQSTKNGRRPTADRRRRQEASAFIIALGVLVILFIMAITFATMMTMESRAARNYNDAALCEDVAYGALEEAINALFRDKYGEDASVVAGSLVLEPYDNSNDQGDENWDAWAYPTLPGHDETLWFQSDGGYLSEDASSNLITDADKSWTTDMWQGEMVQVAGQMRTVLSNDANTITVDEDFDPLPRQGDRYIVFFWYPRASDNAIVRPLPGGLSGRYAILITDDREARVNVNTAGNLAVVGPTHGSNMGASVTEVSLEDLFQLFEDINGTDISQSRAQTLAEAIVVARCTPPGGVTSEPGDDTDDDDGDIGDDGVDNNGDGVVDETNENLNEDDEFNSLFAVEDTPFALPHEVADVFPPADAGTVTSSGVSSLTDNTKSWTADEWIDAVVAVDTDNDGTYDEIRAIIGNTSDVLTADANWGTTPDADDNYAIYFTVVEVPDTCLPTQPAGTSGLNLGDCLTTYSVGTIEHPFLDDAALFGSATSDYIYRRYRFGLNQFEIGAGWPNVTQINDLRDILENRGGFTEAQAYQFIVNFKDALDGDSTVTNYLTYYGVELRPFITEVMRDDEVVNPNTTRAYYFIEFYNPSPNEISISGWQLVITDGPGETEPLTIDFTGDRTISGGGFYVIGGRALDELVDWERPALRRDYDPADPPDNLDITAIRFTCANDVPLPNGTIIDKADGFGDFDSGTSKERSDFKVDDWSLEIAGHTFGSAPSGGFTEIFDLFIVPIVRETGTVTLPLDPSSLTDNTKSWTSDEWIGFTVGVDTDDDGVYDEIRKVTGNDPDTLTVDSAWVTNPAVDDNYYIGRNYDINLANLGDLSRFLVIGYPPPGSTDDSISQVFADVEAGTLEYRDIKFDPSYYDAVAGTGPREVLDYLTILNPMGDGYDDDGDGTPDDTGPTGLVPAGADDLGGPEHRIPGMININTASREVLMALPGMDAFENDGVDNDGDTSTDEVGEGADTIIANRPYTQIGDLLSISGMDWLGNNSLDDNGNGIVDETEEEFLIFGALSNIVTTRSNVFTVYCLAQVGIWNDLPPKNDIVDPGEFTTFAERKLMAIVDRSTQPINVRFQRWLTD